MLQIIILVLMLKEIKIETDIIEKAIKRVYSIRKYPQLKFDF